MLTTHKLFSTSVRAQKDTNKNGVDTPLVPPSDVMSAIQHI